MEIDKTVSNPMLVGAMQLIKADGKNPVPEHQAMFMQELDKADLIAPADVKEELNEDGSVKEGGKTAVRFPVLTGSDGKKFFVVFTDNASLEQARSVDGTSRLPEEFMGHSAKVKFFEIARMLLTPNPDGTENPAFGIVINPFMENIVIPKTMIVQMVQQTAKEAMARMAKMQGAPGQAAPSAADGGQVIQFPGNDKGQD
ncbi:MAG: SseB family protein [Lachnospiraceae bacterium]|nr:SseB family protein [Lachnospiraceae bacterium]MBP1584306.1 SseB family protein [Lachnospiraceae bacterium]